MHSFQSHYCPGGDSASNRNEYQEYFLGGKADLYVKLITLPHSCADRLEILEPHLPGKLRTCPGSALLLRDRTSTLLGKTCENLE